MPRFIVKPRARANPRPGDPYQQMADNVLGDVREALSADPDIAEMLRRHPEAVRTRRGPLDRSWNTIELVTEYGVGDPYHYPSVKRALDRAIKSLKAKRWLYTDAYWDSVRAGVVEIGVTPMIANPAGPSQPSIQKFREFHRFEPRRTGAMHPDFEIPTHVRCIGDASFVLYRSDKTDPETLRRPQKPIDYIHEHDPGVRCYVTDGEPDTEVPSYVTQNDTLVLLGLCLGFGARDGDVELEAEGEEPYSELYCIPSGRALLVVDDKRSVYAMMWGGDLRVESRGIVG